jgi:transketolase
VIYAIEHTEGPTLFALTRQAVPHLDRSSARDPGVAKGAYILEEPEFGPPDVILIGTGSEVALCVKARAKLQGYGVKARVVSMPSWEIFEAQPESYRESVLPKSIRKRVTVEAASPMGWCKWAGEEGTIIGINRFGASAPGEENMKHLGFTPEHVTAAALRLMGKHREAEREYNGS